MYILYEGSATQDITPTFAAPGATTRCPARPSEGHCQRRWPRRSRVVVGASSVVVPAAHRRPRVLSRRLAVSPARPLLLRVVSRRAASASAVVRGGALGRALRMTMTSGAGGDMAITGDSMYNLSTKGASSMPPLTAASVNPSILCGPSKTMITTTTPPPQEKHQFSASLAYLGQARSQKQSAGAVFLPDANMTPDDALLHLRRKISMQMTGGSHGLMRCWVLFRTRAGSSKDGITFPEFCRGLRCYGLPLPEAISRNLFDRMDANHDGTIHIKEFIDHVMGRWSPVANTHFGSKTEEEIQGNAYVNAKAKQKAMVVDEPDDALTSASALVQLRRAIVQRLKSGPNGLLRCWIEFRQRAGSTKDGITYPEFMRGLRAYGIPLQEDLARKLHAQMDSNGDGHIHISEFVDKVMGRWASDTNTHFGGKKEDEIAGSGLDRLRPRGPRGGLHAPRRLPQTRRRPRAPAEARRVRLRQALDRRLGQAPPPHCHGPHPPHQGPRPLEQGPPRRPPPETRLHRHRQAPDGRTLRRLQVLPLSEGRSLARRRDRRVTARATAPLDRTTPRHARTP